MEYGCKGELQIVMYSVVISNNIKKKRVIVLRRDGNHEKCFNKGRVFLGFFDNTVRESFFLFTKEMRIFSATIAQRISLHLWEWGRFWARPPAVSLSDLKRVSSLRWTEEGKAIFSNPPVEAYQLCVDRA